jgi:Mg2+/citrate symporter
VNAVGSWVNLRGVRKVSLPKWFWWTFGVLIALQLYFVRELLAAFVLFTIGFSVLAVIALVFYVVERAGEWSMARVEPHAREIVPKLREGVRVAEEISRKTFRRPRSESAL